MRVSDSVKVTVALATNAPVESVMCPDMAAFAVCALPVRTPQIPNVRIREASNQQLVPCTRLPVGLEIDSFIFWNLLGVCCGSTANNRHEIPLPPNKERSKQCVEDLATYYLLASEAYALSCRRRCWRLIGARNSLLLASLQISFVFKHIQWSRLLPVREERARVSWW
jgi:hypothetical protein